MMLISQEILILKFLTISINVHRTGISLSIVVCVRLVWITVIGAVVTAVTHIIAVIIILPRVVDEWTVVLFFKKKGEINRDKFDLSFAIIV